MKKSADHHKLIQHVQDAFAYQYNLSLLLFDIEGNCVSSTCQTDSIYEFMKENIHCLFSTYPRVVEVSILDIIPGLQVMISPILVTGKNKYYLIAGMLMDDESRDMISKNSTFNTENREKWANLLNQARAITREEKKSLIEKIKILSQTISTLFEYEQHEHHCRELVNGIYRVSELADQNHSISDLLLQFMKMKHDLEFIGFAEKSDEECMVSHILGDKDYTSILGSTFIIGEGFLGHVMASGMICKWNNILNDLRTRFFTRHNIHPQALVCYPVCKDHEIIGVLFAGTSQKSEIDPLTIEIGKIIVNILRSFLNQKEMFATMNLQLQRLNAVNEICQLMNRAKDVNKIAFMLVDMSLNMIQANFSAITLFDLDATSDKVRIVSRGLTREQSEQYGKLLFKEYQLNWNVHSGEIGQIKAEIRKLEWGATVIECPIYNEKLLGVLSVESVECDEDSKVILLSLASIGAVAMHLIQEQLKQRDIKVACLHEAVAQWDKFAYEFSKNLREMALRFCEYIGLSQVERTNVEHAALLSVYHPDVLVGILQNDHEIYRIIDDYYHLHNDKVQETKGNGQAYHLGGQILRIASEYLIKNEKKILMDVHVDLELRQKFNSFILQSEVIDQQVAINDQEYQDIAELSKREQEVLRLIVQGLNNKQIASKLFISEHTVKNHITNIFSKLNIKDRAGVIAYYYRQKMNS